MHSRQGRVHAARSRGALRHTHTSFCHCQCPSPPAFPDLSIDPQKLRCQIEIASNAGGAHRHAPATSSPMRVIARPQKIMTAYAESESVTLRPLCVATAVAVCLPPPLLAPRPHQFPLRWATSASPRAAAGPCAPTARPASLPQSALSPAVGQSEAWLEFEARSVWQG